MEFKFTAEHDALRSDVRAFLKETIAAGPGPVPLQPVPTLRA